MDKEVKIIIRVDGVEKEIKSVADLKSAVKELGDKQKETADKTSFFGEKLKGLKDFISDIKDQAKGLQNDFIGFAKGMGAGEKAAKGLSVGLAALGLPLLLAIITSVVEYLKNFEAGMRLVEAATNTAQAVLKQFSSSIIKLVQLDFGGFIDDFLGIGDAAVDAAKGTYELADANQELIDLQTKNATVNANLNAELERNIKVIEDGTATYEDRVVALKEVERIEKELLNNKKQEIAAQIKTLELNKKLETNDREKANIAKEIAALKAEEINITSELEIKTGDANKAIRELDIERTNKAKEEAEKRRQIEEKFKDDKIKLAQEITLLEIENDRDREKKRIEFELENQLAALEKEELNAEQKGQLRVQIQEKYDLILKGLADKQAEEDQNRINQILESNEVKLIETLAQKQAELNAEEKKQLDELTLLGATEEEKQRIRDSFNEKRAKNDIDARQAVNEVLKQLDFEEIDDVFEKARIELQVEEDKQLKILELNGATEDEITALKQKFSKKRQKIADDEADYEKSLEQEKVGLALDLASQGFDTIAQLAGENSRLGKAAAIASATINTYQAATKALAELPPPFGAIAAGLAITQGLLSVRKIVSTKIPGEAGGGGGGNVGISAPVIQPFDPRQALGNVNLGQTPQNINTQAPVNVKAYVVSSEMTSQQEVDKKINNISKL